MLKLENIKKSYKTGTFVQHALDDIDLEFSKNEFVAVLGPSGSGKTTLLNIIGGLDRYDSGDLIINDKSTKKFKDSDWDAYRNNCIGFIFQSYNLITHITVLENVEMGMTLSGVNASKRKKKAIEVLKMVGLEEHVHKKPNQLSGGQMQRVAIARALVNDPDIILADEPTGALDTKTSIQIMDLIKEISKDKLVIMVTHNSDLANEYANRVIELRDGKVINDTNKSNNDISDKKYNIRKTAMSFFTALNLSFNNIKTKKGRTILTAFASSIGIIGISLILSLSNGFNIQIDKFETDTLSSFPIMITKQAMTMDTEQMKERRAQALGTDKDSSKYPNVDVLYPYDSKTNKVVHNNIIDDKYVDYVEKIDPKLIMGISYVRITNLNLLNKIDNTVKPLISSSVNLTSLPKEIGDKNTFLSDGYDLLTGNYPTNRNELVVVVDAKNRLEKTIVSTLGLNSNKDSIKLNDVIGKEFKLIYNNNYYQKLNNIYTVNRDLNSIYNNTNNETLIIVGVVRAKEDNKLASITDSMLSSSGSDGVGSILYSNELIEDYINTNKDSDIAISQVNANHNVLSGELFTDDATKDNILNYLGAKDIPYAISIYPKDFNNKEDILKYLEKYNDGKASDKQIIYTDMAETFSSLSGDIMDAITIVLIAFSAISLVVSVIMIGIITYISVLERTKEIGILRALGARKKDITRVFNAETFIIGMTSGLIGIVIARLSLFPVNKILEDLTNLSDVAQMNYLHSLILVILSITLTVIGGYIPAIMASKKDPVVALRTE